MKITRKQLKRIIKESMISESPKLTEAVGPWPPNELTSTNVLQWYPDKPPLEKRPQDDFVQVIPSEGLRSYLRQLEERIAALERQEPSPAQVGRKERDLDEQGYKSR